jgi:hypothetical protein
VEKALQRKLKLNKLLVSAVMLGYSSKKQEAHGPHRSPE